MTTHTPTQTLKTRLHRLRDAFSESARDERHQTLWSGPKEIDRVELLSVGQRERLLRRGLVRRPHGVR